MSAEWQTSTPPIPLAAGVDKAVASRLLGSGGHLHTTAQGDICRRETELLHHIPNTRGHKNRWLEYECNFNSPVMNCTKNGTPSHTMLMACVYPAGTARYYLQHWWYNPPISNFTELHALILATLSSCTLANSVVTCLRAQAALVPSASEQLIILVGILHQERVDIEL